MPDDTVMRLIYLGLLLATLAGWAAVELRKGLGRSVKMVLAWGMILLGLMAVYGLWGDITRGLRPSQQAGAAEVTLPRAEDGHYYAQLQIQGQEISFMVDTGASDVVLTQADADPSVRCIVITGSDTAFAAGADIKEMATQSFEPHRIAFYLQELASELHSLWHKGNENHELKFIIKNNSNLTNSRLLLVFATKKIIATGLEIFNIKPCEEMK